MATVIKGRRALILYATMTKNTEKVATWFKETLESYNWEVTFIRIAANTNWAELQDKCYFDDYDLVALGSPIVAGSPLQPVIKVLSLGGGADMINKIGKKPADPNAPAPMIGPKWRRGNSPSPGMADHESRHPLGIAFVTYGGGFYGSAEALPSLETLKQYLFLNYVDVIGRFACAGKESGPAGYPVGVKPKAWPTPGMKMNEAPLADICDAVMYEMPDGTQKPGSYFFHYDCDSKPGAREEAKARAFISDIVEDYFMTYDGKPNPAFSEIISIS